MYKLDILIFMAFSVSINLFYPYVVESVFKKPNSVIKCLMMHCYFRFRFNENFSQYLN